MARSCIGSSGIRTYPQPPDQSCWSGHEAQPFPCSPSPQQQPLTASVRQGYIEDLGLVSARTTRILRRVGWAYVIYHAVIATLLVASAIQNVVPGSWGRTEFQIEILSVILIYPAVMPAFAVCGGLHDRCTTILGHAMQVMAFTAAFFSYLMGCWVLTSFLRQRFLR